MPTDRTLLGAAGNTEIPAILELRRLGFMVRREDVTADDERWIAESESVQYSACSPLELLGLASLHRARGAEWRATDDEITACLAEYYEIG